MHTSESLRVISPARVDAFVRAAHPDWSRRTIDRLLADGAIRVNGRVARKGDALRAGDEVLLPVLGPLAADPEQVLVVAYEDDSLAVIEKPAGTPCHALDPRERGTLVNALLARFPEIATVGDPLAPGLAHRIDTGTSGLVVVARTRSVWEALRRAFRERTVEKGYLGVVGGCMRDPQVVEVPLSHDPIARARMVPAVPGEKAWPARTELRPLRIAETATLVDVRMRTGVTHQVRAHLAVSGWPLLGDALYGGPPAPLPPGRHALHAARVALTHPVSLEPLVVVSPLPADLAALLGDVGA